MRIQELEKKIHGYIIELYKKEYVGFLEVHKDNNIYSLVIGLPSPNIPTHISIQAQTDDEFFKYIKEELRTRNFLRVYFYNVKKTDMNVKQSSRKVLDTNEAQ